MGKHPDPIRAVVAFRQSDSIALIVAW